jgi:hypothetical protein
LKSKKNTSAILFSEQNQHRTRREIAVEFAREQANRGVGSSSGGIISKGKLSDGALCGRQPAAEAMERGSIHPTPTATISFLG